MKLTDNEQAYYERIRLRMDELKQVLNENDAPLADDILIWFKYIAEFRKKLGNISNDQSFLATMLAKQYLIEDRQLKLSSYDAAEKPQGAAGLDIDEQTVDGKRIVAEIKTTVPYGKSDLGSAQRTSFRKDFAKLNGNDAHYKFFFVTDPQTYDIVQDRYIDEIPNVEVILLTNP